jgi:hypothetical protein
LRKFGAHQRQVIFRRAPGGCQLPAGGLQHKSPQRPAQSAPRKRRLQRQPGEPHLLQVLAGEQAITLGAALGFWDQPLGLVQAHGVRVAAHIAGDFGCR